MDMNMTKEDAEYLMDQLQAAHRISVGFYRRILPILDSIANEADCQFYDWGPLLTSMPSIRSRDAPSFSWAWDYVPLFSSFHNYVRINGEAALPSDVGLCLCLHIDTGFEDSLKEQGDKGEPDAVDLPIGKAVLRGYIYRPMAVCEISFSKLWTEATYPGIGNSDWQGVGENIKAIGFEWPLAEVIRDIKPIVGQLKSYTV